MLRRWLYRWLPIIFGCHCRADRSFYWRGEPFPICARCTGELVGMLLCAVISWFFLPPVWLAAVLLLPMLADGIIQMCTRYESTNVRRLVTGILAGYGGVSLVVIHSAALVRFGISLGQRLAASR